MANGRGKRGLQAEEEEAQEAEGTVLVSMICGSLGTAAAWGLRRILKSSGVLS